LLFSRRAAVSALKSFPLGLNPSVNTPEHNVSEVQLRISDVDRGGTSFLELSVQPIVDSSTGSLVKRKGTPGRLSVRHQHRRFGQCSGASGGLDVVSKVVLRFESFEIVHLIEALSERFSVSTLTNQSASDILVSGPALKHILERLAAIRIIGSGQMTKMLVKILNHGSVHAQELDSVSRKSLLKRSSSNIS
jgi:predicted dinucleotide-utilizing enzyme